MTLKEKETHRQKMYQKFLADRGQTHHREHRLEKGDYIDARNRVK